MRSILIMLLAVLCMNVGPAFTAEPDPETASAPEDERLAQRPGPSPGVNPAPAARPGPPPSRAPGLPPPVTPPFGAGAALTVGATAIQDLSGTAVNPSRFSSRPIMLGDQSPILSLRQPGRNAALLSALPNGIPPRTPRPQDPSALVTTVRGLKISENQSPEPQDRFFYSFNFFAQVNQHLNQRFEAQITDLRVYREVFGLEKTFDDGNSSLGIQLPLNTTTANPTGTGKFAMRAGTSTALGDLGFFGKRVVWADPETGSLITCGLAITAPTGPGQFAGASYLLNLHSTEIQPFAGYIWSRDRFYLHGFLALDTPTTLRIPTLVYNDVGVGYYLLRRTEPEAWLTAVVPTFEVHVNTPLTHRDPFNSNDPGGTPDVVNLTYGLNFEFNHRSMLTFGMATPTTGPRPFDYEAILLFNLRFGGTTPGPRSTPTMIGG